MITVEIATNGYVIRDANGDLTIASTIVQALQVFHTLLANNPYDGNEVN